MTYKIVGIIICVIVILFILYYLFPIVKVCGNSMYPTYINGEFLLCTRIFIRVKPGDVVVFRTPYDRKRIVVKRVKELHPVGPYMWCEGDNTDHSYDSRRYGYIPTRNVICKPFSQRVKEEIYE